MRYLEVQPKPALNRFVECFWTLEDEEVAGPPHPERILPDGCVELILNFGAHFSQHKEKGEAVRQPLRYVVGQMTRPILVAPTGRVQLMGIRFHPGGTLPFFRLPMNEVTDRVVELAGLDGNLDRNLVAAAGDGPLLSQRIAAVEDWLIKRARDCKHDSWLVELASTIISRQGQLSVDRMAKDAGVSGRQLERRFLREVGIGPKLFCRILRFQQVFRAFEQTDAGWAAVAADCGYYDQAHLIRDFQQFAGQTPSVLLTHTSALTESFTRKNRTSHFSNTPA